MAVDVLRSKGVPEERILFLNLIASPEGAAKFAQKYPRLRIVTAFVDRGLNEKKCVLFNYVFSLSSVDRLTLKTVTLCPGSAILAIGSIPSNDFLCVAIIYII